MNLTKEGKMSDITNLKDSKALKVCYFFTNLTYYLSLVCFVGVSLLLAVDGITGMKVINHMQLPIEVTYEEIGRHLPLDQIQSDDLMPVIGFQQVKLDVSNFDHMAQNMWIPLILLVGLIYVLYLFRLFLRTVRENSPFAPENPQRLKRIGYLVTAAGPVAGIMNNIYARIYMHYIDLPGATIEVTKNDYAYPIFLGLMIIVIAQIFDMAVKMKLEQDLTV